MWNHGLCTRPAARCTSLIIGMEFTIESCVWGHCFSKEFYTPKVGEELASLSTQGRQSKWCVHGCCRTVGTKTFQIKRNNDLSSFQWHFTIDFVITERKLTHGLVKVSACSISHFVMNIIMAKTGSTAKVNSTKWHIFSNPPKYLPTKISSHMVRICSDNFWNVRESVQDVNFHCN